MMEAANTSETSENFYQTVRRNIPKTVLFNGKVGGTWRHIFCRLSPAIVKKLQSDLAVAVGSRSVGTSINHHPPNALAKLGFSRLKLMKTSKWQWLKTISIGHYFYGEWQFWVRILINLGKNSLPFEIFFGQVKIVFNQHSWSGHCVKKKNPSPSQKPIHPTHSQSLCWLGCSGL
jgi:hypothetical protein